jgi:hypothetical protein
VYRSYVASGIAFYAPAGHRLSGSWVYLWEDGKLIASERAASFGSATGWIKVPFRDAARVLQPGRKYVAAYLAERGRYAATEGYFDTARGPAGLGLQVPAAGGVYRDLGGPENPVAIPEDTWNGSNYWVTPYLERVERPFNPTVLVPWALYQWAPSTSPLLEPTSVDEAELELGARFSVVAPPADAPGYVYKILGVRYYREPHLGIFENHVRLYDSEGTELAHTMGMGEGSKSGWVDIGFMTPVTARAGETYTATYYAPEGGYTDTLHGFDFPVTAGPLTFPVDAGVYRNGQGFPTDTWESSDYHVTPIVELVKVP